jgi:hypothetical protein
VMVTLVIFLILCNRVTCREKAAGRKLQGRDHRILNIYSHYKPIKKSW